MPTKDGYPTGDEILRIKYWPYTDPLGLIKFLRTCWWEAETGIRMRGQVLQLHTWGWSGNEILIDTLQNNVMFWALFWQKSFRGGHYWFHIFQPKEKAHGS